MNVLRRDVTFDLEVQNLSQDIATQPEFAGYTYDWRGLVRVTYWFFAASQAGGTP